MILGDQILLIIDGSAAARQAADMAVELALLWGAPLRAAYILDESWSNILGDEWMSSSKTRTQFYDWLEDGLVRQAGDALESTARRAADAGIEEVQTEIVAGPTEKVMAGLVGSRPTRLLVLPHPDATAPRAEAGLKYNLHALRKKIKCPLLTGPYIR